jgi:hypothetical protein
MSSGFVYFLQVENCEGKPIKIGHTCRGPETRLREIQNGMPFHVIKLLGSFPASREKETFLKKIFEKNMIVPDGKPSQKTEWFWPDKSLLEYINRATQNAVDK